MLISMLLGEGDLGAKLKQIGLYLIAIIISLSIHEWGHAFAAHLNGDDTARNYGRMTLNPLAHIDPRGLIFLLLIGFGWAKPVPVNSRNYKNYRLGEFTVSFAGIFMNLVLALLAAAGHIIYAYVCIKKGSEPSMNLIMFFDILGMLNCSLAVFNLIPVYPLDGSHIFELIFGKLVGPKVLNWMHRNGTFILYGVLILSVVLSYVTDFSLIGDAAYGIFSLFIKLMSRVFFFIVK